MSVYLDTSVLQKLLFAELESDRATEIVGREPEIVISSLAVLESLVQLDGMVAGGLITRRKAANRAKQIEAMEFEEPFLFLESPADLIRIARSQLGAHYCRTLDRLHLAAMQGLGLSRLFTNDDQQATAARALGFDVIMPR